MARNLKSKLNNKHLKEAIGSIVAPATRNQRARIENPRLLDKTVGLKNAISKFTTPKATNFGNKMLTEWFINWAR